MTNACAEPIARDRWSDHENFPAHALLLGSHANFLRISSYLVEQARAGHDTRPLQQLYRRWIGAMRSHEAYEEHKLYPFLSRRWGVSCESASDGHQTLHERDEAVRAAFAGALAATAPSADQRAELARALEAHDEALVEHLRVEEDLVIPLLLALTREEFESYYTSPPD